MSQKGSLWEVLLDLLFSINIVIEECQFFFACDKHAQKHVHCSLLRCFSQRFVVIHNS